MSIYGGQSYSDQPEYEAPSDPWGDPNRRTEGYRAGAYGGGGYHDPAYQSPEHGGSEYGGSEYSGTQYGAPAYDQPGYGGTQYGGAEYRGTEYGGTEYAGTQYPGTQDQDSPPPGHSSAKLLAAIVGALAVLLIVGVTAVYFVTRHDDSPAQAAQKAGPSGAAAAAGVEPTAAGATGSPAPESSAEARFATTGQCLVNDGTNAKPSMRIVACAPGTYQVLARFDGTTDYAGKCAKVKGYKFHYYFDAELNSLDFVLCLKKR